MADQDGDGDDDVVCSNHYLGEDLNAGTYDGDFEPGVVAVFFNRNSTSSMPVGVSGRAPAFKWLRVVCPEPPSPDDTCRQS